MKILVLDTETSGLFRYDRRADAEGQPRMIELSCSLRNVDLDEPGVVAEGFTQIIKPDGWEMDDNLANQLGHGLTQARLLEIGVPVKDALDAYMELYNQADVIVGYSVAFDQKMLRAELRKAGMPDLYGLKPEFDVMRACKQFCNAKDKNGRPKNPKLHEAVRGMLGRDHAGAHTAEADCMATVELYFELKRRGVDVRGTVPESKLQSDTKNDVFTD